MHAPSLQSVKWAENVDEVNEFSGKRKSKSGWLADLPSTQGKVELPALLRSPLLF